MTTADVKIAESGSPTKNVATYSVAEDAETKQVQRVALNENDGSDTAIAAKLGGLTETAPASDTASSGLNGRLQRIAQRLTSLIAFFGAQADAASTATDTTAVSPQQVWKQISKTLQAFATAATGIFARITDGTNTAGVDASHGLKVLAFIDAGSVNSNVNADNVNSKLPGAPVTAYDYYGDWETVAASATDQVMGSTGAAGDYLAGVLIVPGTTAAGAVSIKDGAGSSISIFAGGGTTALTTLIPFWVPLGIYCSTAWKITTGTNVTVIGVGKFT